MLATSLISLLLASAQAKNLKLEAAPTHLEFGFCSQYCLASSSSYLSSFLFSYPSSYTSS